MMSATRVALSAELRLKSSVFSDPTVAPGAQQHLTTRPNASPGRATTLAQDLG